MRYNIIGTTIPAMLALDKGTKCIKILLFQA